MKLYEDNG